MARVLVPCTPLLGHLQPLLAVASALRRRGHEVDVLTAADHAAQVRGRGLTLIPLPPAAVGRTASRARIDRAPRWVHARRDVIARFVDPLRAQSDALTAALGASRDGDAYDVVVADTAYLGVLPLLLGDTTGTGTTGTGTTGTRTRPPVMGISTTPIATVSVDAAPFGSGLRNSDSRFARRRNRQVNWLLHRGPLRPLQGALDEAVAPFGVPRGAAGYFDVLTHFDRVCQLSLPELEYPRRELPSTVQCVGPLLVEVADWRPPSWWAGLDNGVVVHVTQGTVDNADLGRLVVPAVRALLTLGVRVVVTTGSGGASRALDPVRSDRLHVADFLPYSELLPKVDLVITNGGWGGVQLAARYGVPVIVAGATEEKPEVGARVAWSGLGVDLRTGTPRPARIRTAVETVLGTDRFRDRAVAIAAAAARRPDPLDQVVAGVEALLRPPPPPRSTAEAGIRVGRASAVGSGSEHLS